MSGQRLKIRVTRAMLYDGAIAPPGTLLTLDPAEAQDALDSGRAELVDANDRAAAMAGRRAAVVALMRREQRLAPPPDGPWFPMGH